MAEPSSPDTYALSRLAERLENSPDRWRDDPAGWVETRLGGQLWSRQRDVANLVVANRRVAVRSGHSVGKTRLAATLAAWWIDTRPVGEAMVVTTAPTFAQVSQVFWQELRRIHAAGGLPGTITGDNRWTMPDGTLVGIGRRPADWTGGGSALSGYHKRWLLMVIDEAGGVPRWIFDAAETITVGDDCRILAIGNPDAPGSHFAAVHSTEPTWERVRIACTDTPAFTGEDFPEQLTQLLVRPDWVEDKKLRWGEDSPLYQAKILGEFADSGENALIPMSWVRLANERWQAWQDNPLSSQGHEPAGPITVGVDVGWLGNDATALCIRQGDVVHEIKTYNKMDTSQVTALVMAELGTTGASCIVDSIGIGAGVLDQLRHAGANVQPFNGSWTTKRMDATSTWKFRNVRAAAWWHLRELLDPAAEPVLALPPDDDLTADLITPRWEPAAGGYINIESKADQKKRLGRSPDLGDSLVMSCWIHSPRRRGGGEPTDPDTGPYARPYRTTQRGYDITNWQPNGYRRGGGATPWMKPRRPGPLGGMRYGR